MKNWISIAIVLVAAAISGGIGYFFIPFLKRLHFGQPIKTEFGPKWHEKKQGTPTMGGFLFIIGSIVASAIGFFLFKTFRSDIVYTTVLSEKSDTTLVWELVACILYCLSFSLIGFIDDFIKVSKKHNLGLKAYQKVILQVIFSALFLGALYLINGKDTTIDLLFVKFDIGYFYYPIMIIVMIYLTNAVNLTDGVDGLCGCVTIVSMLLYFLTSVALEYYNISVFTVALAGALLGFLVWNLHPAKCFMGDTGSMFLGAAVTSVGLILHQHLLLILFNIVYILEALSVVIQVSYFKYTAKKHFKATGEKGKGKRIFKMTPIHHHFELSGFSEYKICITFSLTAIVFGAVGIVLLFFLR
jgi:phospho-N-acetylmuramoyl-pentapeptide-transferase